MTHTRRNGLARADVLALCSCAAIVVAIGAVAFGDNEKLEPVRSVKSIRDATQISQLHKAMLIYANETKGILPMPGAIDRKPDKDLGEVPGKGEIDWEANTTANLYSVLICQNYFTPELPLSPVERNTNVTLDKDYNYDAYNPAQDTYWDATFTADLKTGSNVSYAHQPLVEARVKRLWTNNMDANLGQLGNRGPRKGAINPDSITCDPHGNWSGNICFGDNHVAFYKEMEPAALEGDNFFRVDDRELDTYIVFTKAFEKGQPVTQSD